MRKGFDRANLLELVKTSDYIRAVDGVVEPCSDIAQSTHRIIVRGEGKTFNVCARRLSRTYGTLPLKSCSEFRRVHNESMHPIDQAVAEEMTESVKKIHELMKAKGFKMQSTVQSAMMEFRYFRVAETCSLEVHHGRGKWGPERAILSFYHNRIQLFNFHSSAYRKHRKMDSIITEEGAKMHTQMIAGIVNFISALK